MKLTGFELNVVNNLVTTSGMPGKIRDLRLIKKLQAKVKESLPHRDPQPPRPTEDMSDEQKQELASQWNVWNKNMVLVDQQEFDLELNDAEMIVIKTRMAAFEHFTTDAPYIDKILALADKFGV